MKNTEMARKIYIELLKIGYNHDYIKILNDIDISLENTEFDDNGNDEILENMLHGFMEEYEAKEQMKKDQNERIEETLKGVIK